MTIRGTWATPIHVYQGRSIENSYTLVFEPATIINGDNVALALVPIPTHLEALDVAQSDQSSK